MARRTLMSRDCPASLVIHADGTIEAAPSAALCGTLAYTEVRRLVSDFAVKMSNESGLAGVTLPKRTWSGSCQLTRPLRPLPSWTRIMTGACHWAICEMLWLIFISSARILPSRSRSMRLACHSVSASWHCGCGNWNCSVHYLDLELLHRALQLAGLPSYHANKQMQYSYVIGPALLSLVIKA